MRVFLNGQIIEEEKAFISVHDRGFTMGDGIFETILVRNRKCFRLDKHLQRLQTSADFTRIPLPPIEETRTGCYKVIEANSFSEGVLRITVSRGTAPRQAGIPKDCHPTIVITPHPVPEERRKRAQEGFRAITSNFRVPACDKLAQQKSTSRLLYALASDEASSQSADEAILMNTEGQLTEGSASNLFWVEDQTVCTTPTSIGALPGITRDTILEICRGAGISTEEKPVTPEEIFQAAGAFFTFTSLGVVELLWYDNHGLSRTPIVAQLREEYWKLVEKETR